MIIMPTEQGDNLNIIMNHLFIEDDVDHLVDDTDSGTNDADDATVPNDYSNEDTCFLLLFFFCRRSV